LHKHLLSNVCFTSLLFSYDLAIFFSISHFSSVCRRGSKYFAFNFLSFALAYAFLMIGSTWLLLATERRVRACFSSSMFRLLSLLCFLPLSLAQTRWLRFGLWSNSGSSGSASFPSSPSRLFLPIFFSRSRLWFFLPL
jgi:hypothetical protein